MNQKELCNRINFLINRAKLFRDFFYKDLEKLEKLIQCLETLYIKHVARHKYALFVNCAYTEIKKVDNIDKQKKILDLLYDNIKESQTLIK